MIAILTILILPIHKHVFKSLISPVLCSFQYMPYISFVKFIPIDTILSDIVSWFHFWIFRFSISGILKCNWYLYIALVCRDLLNPSPLLLQQQFFVAFVVVTSVSWLRMQWLLKQFCAPSWFLLRHPGFTHHCFCTSRAKGSNLLVLSWSCRP